MLKTKTFVEAAAQWFQTTRLAKYASLNRKFIIKLYHPNLVGWYNLDNSTSKNALDENVVSVILKFQY